MTEVDYRFLISFMGALSLVGVGLVGLLGLADRVLPSVPNHRVTASNKILKTVGSRPDGLCQDRSLSVYL